MNQKYCNYKNPYNFELVASLSFSSKFCGLEAHSLNTGVHHSKYTENVTCILYHQSTPKKQHIIVAIHVIKVNV